MSWRSAPDTRILIEANARISLLSGWLKIAHQCVAPPCAAPAVETERGTVEIGDHAAAIVAVVAAPDLVSEAFSESGIQRLAVPGNGGSATDDTVLAEGQFATIASNAPVNLKPRPSPAFIDAMPIAFRDALIHVAAAGKLHDNLPAPLRPVSFEDVAPWLMSALPARNQTRNPFRRSVPSASRGCRVSGSMSNRTPWRCPSGRPPRLRQSRRLRQGLRRRARPRKPVRLPPGGKSRKPRPMSMAVNRRGSSRRVRRLGQLVHATVQQAAPLAKKRRSSGSSGSSIRSLSQT